MREEKLHSIRKEIKRLTEARKKYIGRKKRMEKLSEDPKVQEYIRLQQAQEKTDKFIKKLDLDMKDNTAQTEIRKYVFEQGIEKIPAEETNNIYVYQGRRKLDTVIYDKYHNIEKKKSIYIREENSEEFERDHTVILPPELNVTIDEEERIFKKLQNEFFEEMIINGQEQAKQFILKKYNVR